VRDVQTCILSIPPSPPEIRDIQQMLSDLGYDLGRVDGQWGRRSTVAIEKFYQDRGERFDGEVSANEIRDLLGAKPSIQTEVPSSPEQNQQKASHGPIKPSIREITQPSTVSIPEYGDDATIVHGINYFDIDGDGRNEVFFCGATYRDFVDHPVTVLSVGSSGAKDVTSSVFSGDVPTSNDCTMIIFADLNADGLQDLVYSESGMDTPPWTGTAIEVALNTGSGFRRITNQFEEKIFGIRSYAVAAGNLDRDSGGEIILSSGTDAKLSRVIQFSGSRVTIGANKWVRSGNWYDSNNASNMQVIDIDNDGRNDLYLGGQWSSPANQVYWSGLSASSASALPDTKFGHYKGNWDGRETTMAGADVVSSAIGDFDLDGDLDIVNAYEAVSGVWDTNTRNFEISYGNSYLQILEQTSRRRFKNVAADFSDDLGPRYYDQPFVVDLNHDGLDDIIFNYWTKLWNRGGWATGNKFSSTILMNEGNMNFAKFDAKYISGYNRIIDGIIFPINIENGGNEILVLQPNSGDRSSGQNRRFVSYRANITFN
jgi:hypothetical protein